MHVGFRQHFQRRHGVFQLDPVELYVLACGEMPVSLVELARDAGEGADLLAAQRAIRHGHTQHVGVKLEIQAVHQAQRLEFFFGQVTGNATIDLITELLDPLTQEGAIDLIVAVATDWQHGGSRFSACHGFC